MTNHFNQSSCERFGRLISAKVDGELELEVSKQLDQHLEMCTICRQRMQVFGEINELVYSAAAPDETAFFPVKPVEKRLVEWHNKIGKSLMRWIPLAVAASVLIGFIIIALPSGPTVTAEQIAMPLAELEMINDEQSESQAQMLKTLEFELRALKLELGSLNGESDSEDNSLEEKKRVEETLDRLIEKVKQFGETETNQDNLF